MSQRNAQDIHFRIGRKDGRKQMAKSKVGIFFNKEGNKAYFVLMI